MPRILSQVKLGDLGYFFRGGGGTREDEDPDGLPCIRYGDLYTHHDCVVKSFVSFISKASTGKYTRLQTGDVVFAGSGETHDEIGKAVAYCDEGPAYAGGDTIIFRPNAGVSPRFLGYAVNGERANRYKSRMGQGSSVIHISAEHLSSLPLRLPTPERQHRIAEILSTVDEAIEGAEKLIAKHQQIKAGLMHDLFTRGLTPDGRLRPPYAECPSLYKDSPLGPIPKEWDVAPCSGICLSVIDCKNRTPPSAPEGHPVVRTPNVRDGRFVWEDLVYTDAESYVEWTARGRPLPGDIVITREAPVGEVCVLPEELGSPCLGQRIMLYRPNPERVLGSYLLYALQSHSVQQLLDRISGGSTVGHVRVGDIRDLPVPKASLVEQEAISELLETEVSAIRAEELRLGKLRLLRRGLMHDLLTGKVEVPASNDSEEAA